METKAISQQQTLLPSFGYFAEPGTAAHAWHYGSGNSGGGTSIIAAGVATDQQDVLLSVSPDFDKDVLGQYIHKIYCRDCCRSAEERQQQQLLLQPDNDASQSQRTGGGSKTSLSLSLSASNVDAASAVAVASSAHDWDQQQQHDDVQDVSERQLQSSGSGDSAAASTAGTLLLSSLFLTDANNAAAAAAFVGLDKDKNKESLKRKLLLRRSAGELPLDQEKRSPQKSPPLFAQQRKHLQRAQNGASYRRAIHHEGCSAQWPLRLETATRQAILETEASPAKRPRSASRCDAGNSKEPPVGQPLPPTPDVLGDLAVGERLLTRSDVEPPSNSPPPIEGCCSASGFAGGSPFASEGLVGCDSTPANGYNGDGIQCVDDGSACMRLKIGDATNSSRYTQRSDDYSIGGGGQSCHTIGPHCPAEVDSADEPQLLLAASSTSPVQQQQHVWQDVSPSLLITAESCCLADSQHCCNQKTGSSYVDGETAAEADGSVKAATSTPAGLHMIAGATVAPTASSGGTAMPATSAHKLQCTKTNSLGSSGGSNHASKKAKPKAHTKTKVIKFHEYKGPPQQSSTSTTSKTTTGHPSVSSVTAKPGSAAAAASTVPPTTRATAAASSPIDASTSDSPQAAVAPTAAAGTVASAIATGATAASCESSTTADSTCTAINAEMARYHLMLRQQQLFLQWQLEVQQKSMPLLMPMVQTPPTPSPPLNSRHAGTAVVMSAAATAQTPLVSAQRTTAASPAGACVAAATAAVAADVASVFAQLQSDSQQTKVDGLSGRTESTQARPCSTTSSCANSSSSTSSNCNVTLPPVHVQSGGEISSTTGPTASATDAAPSEYIAVPSIRIIQESLPHASALGMPVQLLAQQQPLLPTLSAHNCKDDAPNRMQPNILEDMKIVELKAELKQRGLPVSGSKQQLIKRLLQSQQLQHKQQSDGLAPATTGAVAASASASCSPLSAPSTMSLASPPSTPPGLSSNCDDGYLQMLSISTTSSTGSLTATEEEERISQQQQLQHRGSCSAFLSASATVHEEIVRQQQRQIEELQKMLHESRLQLSTQQLQAGTSTRKDRKSPKKPQPARGGAAAAITSAGGGSRGSTAGNQQRPVRAAEEAGTAGSSGSSSSSSGRSTPAASQHRQSKQSPVPAAAAAGCLPPTMPVLRRSSSLYTAYSPEHHSQASLTAAALSPPGSSTSPPASLSEQLTGSADELPRLSLQQSTGIAIVPVGPMHEPDAVVLSTNLGSDTTNSVMATNTAAAADMTSCEEISSGNSPSSIASLDDLKANAPPTTTTMDDVLEMLIAATPDLIESMSDHGEGDDHLSMTQEARLGTEPLKISQRYTPTSHVPSSNIASDVRRLFDQQCSRDGGISSHQPVSTACTADAAITTRVLLRAASPTVTDWSELVGDNYFHMEDDDYRGSASAYRFGNGGVADGEADSSSDGCSAGTVRKPDGTNEQRLQHIDDATSTSLSLDDFDANLGTLEFKDEGGGCCSSAGTLDWLDVVMHQQGGASAATPGAAVAGLFPLGFQSDPLLTSHPAASMADLFTMDDADFGMLSEFGCGISWEKLHEVTTA